METFAGIDEGDLGDEGIAAGSATSGAMDVSGADAASRLHGLTFDDTTSSEDRLLDDLTRRVVGRLSRMALGRPG